MGDPSAEHSTCEYDRIQGLCHIRSPNADTAQENTQSGFHVLYACLMMYLSRGGHVLKWIPFFIYVHGDVHITRCACVESTARACDYSLLPSKCIRNIYLKNKKKVFKKPIKRHIKTHARSFVIHK